MAQQLGISLAGIRQEFPQKDDLVDAWLDRADATMLARFPQAISDSNMSAEQRLRIAIQKWLGALASHHNLTGEMMLYKLKPGHIHLQAAGVFVHWLNDRTPNQRKTRERLRHVLLTRYLPCSQCCYWLR